MLDLNNIMTIYSYRMFHKCVKSKYFGHIWKENIVRSFVSFIIRIIKKLLFYQNKSQYNIDLRLDTNVKCHYIILMLCI